MEKRLRAHQRIIDLISEGEGEIAEQYVNRIMNCFARTGYEDWERRGSIANDPTNKDIKLLGGAESAPSGFQTVLTMQIAFPPHDFSQAINFTGCCAKYAVLFIGRDSLAQRLTIVNHRTKLDATRQTGQSEPNKSL